jgi:hypothetical protein
MSYNVPAVNDVFAVAIKERGAFQQQRKCGGAKRCRGRSPNTVLRSLAARTGRRTFTVLLCAVRIKIIFYPRTNIFLILSFNSIDNVLGEL